MRKEIRREATSQASKSVSAFLVMSPSNASRLTGFVITPKHPVAIASSAVRRVRNCTKSAIAGAINSASIAKSNVAPLFESPTTLPERCALELPRRYRYVLERTHYVWERTDGVRLRTQNHFI